jgi:hypothetical protein
MRDHFRTFPVFNVLANHRVRANRHAAGELRAGMNYCRGMYIHGFD